MIYGTHNSATGGQLVWWLRPLAWLINLTSKCQTKSIEEQLEDGVRLFNLQVTKYNGEWVFSHGTAIYKEELIPTLSLMLRYATQEKPIYFQLVLDNNWFTGQPEEEFRELVEFIVEDLKGKNINMLYAWIEGSGEYPYKSGIQLNYEEHYWTISWAKKYAKSLLDWLPLPKRHARRYNAGYKADCKKKYLMLDFYEL